MNPRTVNRRNFFKFGILVISTGVLTGVGLIAWETWSDTTIIAQPPTPTPIVTPTTLPDITLNVPLMLVIEDGEIVFYDQPEGMPAPYRVPTGTLLNVMVRQERNVNGTEWFYLELTEVGQSGWVKSSELLTISVGPKLAIDDFQFCVGTAGEMTGVCASTLPFGSEEVWLTYQFRGLKRDAVVQTIVVVNGERYHSTPRAWQGGADGKQFLPLVQTHNFTAVPGAWTVQVWVDGEMVAESTVQIRS